MGTVTLNRTNPVHSRLSALENAHTERGREITQLRQEVAVLQKTLDQLLGFHKRDAEYLEFLKAKIAAKLAK